MTSNRLREFLLNGATAIVTVLALTVGGLRVRNQFFRQPVVEQAGPRTMRIQNWRRFTLHGIRKGPPDAPVTIVEFLDYQCPFCRLAAGDLRDLEQWYGNKITVVYRNLPIHKFARPAALAAVCASRVGKFSTIHDLLFAKQDSIGVKPWSSWALDAGIQDTVWFDRCMTDPSVVAEVKRDSADANSLGAVGTPTFLVNDLLVAGNPGLAQWAGYIKAAQEGKR